VVSFIPRFLFAKWLSAKSPNIQDLGV